ncbi:MAG: Zn-ribbon domain-containing OB-fold protein [Actinomycetales bacterium]
MLKPVIRDDFSAEFFDAAAQGSLLLRWSPSSGLWSEPAAVVCAHTQAADLEWKPASGRGHIVSWTAKANRSDPENPTVIAMVETDEGPWLPLWMPDLAPADVRPLARVRIDFVQPTDTSEFLPVARLETSQAAD